MTTLVRSNSPIRDKSADVALVCDWLATNGIDEFLPGQPTFMVRDDQIIYQAFKFKNDRRGYDPADLIDGHVSLLEEDRIVPLLAPVTDDVRAAFECLEAAGRECAYLVEVYNGGTLVDKMDAYRKRLGLADGPTSRIGFFHWDGDDGTELALTVDGDKLQVSVGKIDTKPNEVPALDRSHPVVFEFTAGNVERLIQDLPRLQQWMNQSRS